jgi:hypothetical protein
MASIQFFRPRCGRPAIVPRRCVDVQWRPYVGRGPTSQATRSSRAPQSQHSPSLAPLPLYLALFELGRSTEAPSPPRASSRSCAIIIMPRPNSFHQRTPVPSFTLSTPSLDRLSKGEAALADFATAAMCGTSPEFEAAVVGVARPLLVPPFSLP